MLITQKPVKSATGPSFFALARFCGDWKDAGKSTRAQTDRTGIKRARFHVLVCHGGNSRLLGLDALWVADPAPSQKPCPLVKGWGVGSFLLLRHQRRPSHIQPHRDAGRQERRENERLSARPFFRGHVCLAPKSSLKVIVKICKATCLCYYCMFDVNKYFLF